MGFSAGSVSPASSLAARLLQNAVYRHLSPVCRIPCAPSRVAPYSVVVKHKHQGDEMSNRAAAPVNPGLIAGAVLVVLAASWAVEAFAAAHSISMLRYWLFLVF